MNQIAKCFVVGAAALAVLASSARAQQVQAGLAQDTATVGQPVQLNISVTGGRGAQVPQELKVDGLDIRMLGRSEQMQMQMSGGGFNATVTATYTYLVTPLRDGTFTIPAISIPIGGKTFKTNPLTLQVLQGQGGVPVRPAVPVPPSQRQQIPPSVPSLPPQGPPPSAPDIDQIAFGEMLVPKKSAYVGEIIPVELRFYFDAQYPVRLQDRPSFSGDGFTVLKFSKPVEKQQEIEGRVFNVVTFQTALSAAKSGSLEIPPATVESQIQLPMRAPPGVDDFFGGLFGSLGSESRQMTVRTRTAKIDIKPLPKEGRPDEFSGAIGQFSVQASASPKKSESGDPVSLNVVVSGRGNFEGMGAPVLIESEGWRTYPPSEKFQASPSDPIGFNGEKTFEYMLMAREDRSLTPVAQFSFFDPSIEKYVTLKSNPVAVAARGGNPAQAAPVAAVPSATPQAAPEATPEAPAGDESLLAQNLVPASFLPFPRERSFLIANGAMAVAWCAFLLVGVGRAVARSSYARESASRRENRKLLHKMENPACPPEEFFELGSQFVALRLGAGAAGDVHDRLERSSLGDDRKGAVRQFLDRHEERKYSPGGLGARLDADDRKQILDLLKAFDHELQG